MPEQEQEKLLGSLGLNKHPMDHWISIRFDCLLNFQNRKSNNPTATGCIVHACWRSCHYPPLNSILFSRRHVQIDILHLFPYRVLHINFFTSQNSLTSPPHRDYHRIFSCSPQQLFSFPIWTEIVIFKLYVHRLSTHTIYMSEVTLDITISGSR